CGAGESTRTLATAAAKKALENAGLTAQQLDMIVVATCTPDNTFPSVAAQVHGDISAPSYCFAMDIQAACSGFLYALAVADGFAKAGRATNVLVIGAETFTKLLDWSDRGTCFLFGDGAGAAVLQVSDKQGGLLDVKLHTDGSQEKLLISSGGTATTGTAGVVTMNGKEVYRHAVRAMGGVDEKWLQKHGVNVADVDWLIPHQANLRIIEAAAKAANMPMEKVVVTVNRHANTSGASIPLALDTAWRDGRLKKGDTVLFQAFGAGFTWAEAVLTL
ncbi:MAG: beta-ketoacyl-ACP synthase III, partial [Alphaproteobacteria bacterium]